MINLVLVFLKCQIIFLFLQGLESDGAPISSGKSRTRRQSIQRNPDGSITATFAHSEAFRIPGSKDGGSFGIAQTINIGPNGATIDGGQSFSSDIGGNRVAFGQSNSQNSRMGPNGFSSNGANSVSNSFQNPLFQSSNAQANAFGNQFNQRTPWSF